MKAYSRITRNLIPRRWISKQKNNNNNEFERLYTLTNCGKVAELQQELVKVAQHLNLPPYKNLNVLIPKLCVKSKQIDLAFDMLELFQEEKNHDNKNVTLVNTTVTATTNSTIAPANVSSLSTQSPLISDNHHTFSSRTITAPTVTNNSVLTNSNAFFIMGVIQLISECLDKSLLHESSSSSFSSFSSSISTTTTSAATKSFTALSYFYDAWKGYQRLQNMQATSALTSVTYEKFLKACALHCQVNELLIILEDYSSSFSSLGRRTSTTRNINTSATPTQTIPTEKTTTSSSSVTSARTSSPTTVQCPPTESSLILAIEPLILPGRTMEYAKLLNDYLIYHTDSIIKLIYTHLTPTGNVDGKINTETASADDDKVLTIIQHTIKTALINHDLVLRRVLKMVYLAKLKRLMAHTHTTVAEEEGLAYLIKTVQVFFQTMKLKEYKMLMPAMEDHDLFSYSEWYHQQVIELYHYSSSTLPLSSSSSSSVSSSSSSLSLSAVDTSPLTNYNNNNDQQQQLPLLQLPVLLDTARMLKNDNVQFETTGFRYVTEDRDIFLSSYQVQVQQQQEQQKQQQEQMQQQEQIQEQQKGKVEKVDDTGTVDKNAINTSNEKSVDIGNNSNNSSNVSIISVIKDTISNLLNNTVSNAEPAKNAEIITSMSECAIHSRTTFKPKVDEVILYDTQYSSEKGLTIDTNSSEQQLHQDALKTIPVINSTTQNSLNKNNNNNIISKFHNRHHSDQSSSSSSSSLLVVNDLTAQLASRTTVISNKNSNKNNNNSSSNSSSVLSSTATGSLTTESQSQSASAATSPASTSTTVPSPTSTHALHMYNSIFFPDWYEDQLDKLGRRQGSSNSYTHTDETYYGPNNNDNNKYNSHTKTYYNDDKEDSRSKYVDITISQNNIAEYDDDEFDYDIDDDDDDEDEEDDEDDGIYYHHANNSNNQLRRVMRNLGYFISKPQIESNIVNTSTSATTNTNAVVKSQDVLISTDDALSLSNDDNEHLSSLQYNDLSAQSIVIKSSQSSSSQSSSLSFNDIIFDDAMDAFDEDNEYENDDEYDDNDDYDDDDYEDEDDEFHNHPKTTAPITSITSTQQIPKSIPPETDMNSNHYKLKQPIPAVVAVQKPDRSSDSDDDENGSGNNSGTKVNAKIPVVKVKPSAEKE